MICPLKNIAALSPSLKKSWLKVDQPEEIINRIAIHRDRFYGNVSTFEMFGRGLLRRNDETREQAIALAEAD